MMRDKPLWRTGTRKAIQQANEALAVQRAQAQELPDEVLFAELRRRGYVPARIAPPVVREAFAFDPEDELDENIVLRLPPRRSYTLEVDVIAIHEDASDLGGAQDGIPETLPACWPREGGDGE